MMHHPSLLLLAQGQRGCAFVRYASPHSCAMAIEALHGKYAMKAGELPLVVRYADPPKSQRGNAQGGQYGQGGRGGFPPTGWPQSPPSWPGGPPPIGWPGMPGVPMHPYGGYPPWVMPPSVGQPGNPYGYYGGQYGGGQGGSPAAASQPGGAPPQYPPPGPPPIPGGGSGSPPGGPGPLGGGGGSPGHAWSEHITPEGLRYYYNTQTGTSSWEMPAEMQRGGAGSPPGAQHQQGGVPPLPPLPQTGQGGPPAGGNLDKAMEALQIGGGGGNGGGGINSSSPLGGGGGYAGNGLASIGGLGGLGMPDAGPQGGANGGEQQQWWGGNEQAVNVQ